LTAHGRVLVDAVSIATATPQTNAVSVGLADVQAVISRARIEGATKAYATGASTITANRLDILADATNTSTPLVFGDVTGLITGSGARVNSIIRRTTDAYIGAGGSVSAGTGPVTVQATTHSLAHGNNTLVDVGGFSIGGLVVQSTITGHTIADIGAGATVNAGD